MPQSPSVALPRRWPLVVQAANRDDSTSTDAKLVNAYQETHTQGDSTEVWVYKRPGILPMLTKVGAGRGAYNWNGGVYTIFGTTLYKNGTGIGTVDGTGGVYAFDSCLGATPKMVLGNGVKAYTYDGTTLAQITDADFPTSFVKGWVYLDGTSYVMDPGAHIQGSGINDPATWDPLNSILAQIEPDKGVALSKQLVYAVALKEWTTEMFFDAGNATGSPLGPVQGTKLGIGCANAGSVQSIDDRLYWLSSSRSAAYQVAMLEGLKLKVVSTKPIERLLQGADTTTVYSWFAQVDSHMFYGLTLKNANLTLVYDAKEGAWSQWTDENGNYFPYVASTFDLNNRPVLQHESNGTLCYLNRDYTSDDGDVITVDIITPNFDGDTRRMKNLNMILFHGDQTPGSTLIVRYNDQDYATTGWSTFRTVNMANKKPMLVNNGSFYRRAYQLRHQADTRLRIQALELQLDLGTL